MARAMTEATGLQSRPGRRDSYDFSVILGGPLFQMFCRPILFLVRLMPITKEALIQLAVITLLPVAPLVLTMIPLSELLKRLLQVVL